MIFKGIKKVLEGHFITRYDISYESEDGIPKTYEIISRNKDLRTIEDLRNPKADSVIIIATDTSGEKILLNREYRMAVGDWVYNFPAGLIDDGETPEESAVRELREETGLSLTKITGMLPESYAAIGFANEKNVCVIGTADGAFHESSSTLEEIHAGWYTKDEIRELLRSQLFTARTQAYCYMWSKE